MSNSPGERPGLGRHFFCLIVVLALIGADLGSKSWVMPWLESGMSRYQHLVEGVAEPAVLVRDGHGHERYPLAGEWLSFMHNLNYGAAFGKLGGIPWLLVIGRVIAALVLVVLIVRAPKGSPFYLTALVLILSGALGNLWDNFTYTPLVPEEGRPFGPVRDFIDVYFEVWDWHFPTFNVADSCITVGAILLLLSGFGGAAKSDEESPTEPHA